MGLLLDIFWFIWILKYVLFWLYLWQLKDYHIGRFIDHFRTKKGKKLIFSLEQIIKLVIFIFLILTPNLFSFLFVILFLIYFSEAILFFRSVLNRSFKKPQKTVKALFLATISFAVIIIFWFKVLVIGDQLQLPLILGFDILTPIIISIVVLFFQPFFVAIRNGILGKAGVKMEKVKLESNIKIIAITGSYGKTSTKEFLYTILSKKFKVLKTRDHQNSEIGIAKCILENLNSEHQIFIAEVGAYDKGKVAEVCTILKPDIGIVTGVNEQHLALFGSLQNLLSAEGGGELVKSLANKGTLFVNGDNKYCLDLYKKYSGNKKVYSLSNKLIDSDIWTDEISVKKDGISFIAINKKGEMAHFGAKVLGKQNVQNILGAILIAKELGMSFGEISEACKNISEGVAGMVLSKGKHNISIIDSSYSSNPDGVYADIDYLSIFSNKKVIIMPCLIELGIKSIEIHEKIGKKIAEVCDLAIITSEDKFKEIKRGAIKAGMAEERIILCKKSDDIYSIITLSCKADDAVLLEGRVPKEIIKLLTK